MARPIKHNKEIILNIIEKFSNGEKLKDLFKEYDIVRTTFNDKLKEFGLLDMYARSRHLHGDGFNDEIEILKEEIKSGTLNHAEARVLIDTVKWQASKFYPKMYGDKIDVTTDGEKITGDPFREIQKNIDETDKETD